MPASQAGRRRFDPGRPLHDFACRSEQLAARGENRDDRDGALSPTYHPKWADACASVPPRGAPGAARLLLRELTDAIALEVLYQRVRRRGDLRARSTFAQIIYPERFVEPPAADAGACAGELESGESTSGLEPSRVESRNRGDEATEVGGTAWRSARIVSASAGRTPGNE